MGKFNFSEDDFNLDKKKGVAKTEVELDIEQELEYQKNQIVLQLLYQKKQEKFQLQKMEL